MYRLCINSNNHGKATPGTGRAIRDAVWGTEWVYVGVLPGVR
jgi:hypothetical protein